MWEEARGYCKELSSARPVASLVCETAFQREDGPKRLHLFLGGEGALGELGFLRVHYERFEDGSIKKN